MSSTTQDNDEFPVLKDVVQPGDESVIKTSRLGHEVIREIEELGHDNLSPAEINRDVADQTIEQLLDEVVARHMQAMRNELRELLTQIALNPPDKR